LSSFLTLFYFLGSQLATSSAGGVFEIILLEQHGVSNPPNASLLTTSIGQVNKGNLNPLKREKPNDTPDSSPTASGINSSTVGDEIDVK